MSVIIRLQNLPWSANALDVRNFFKGLSIPDGGVHIVGGEMGDAFIAFSTDEDARQAMMMNGGKIKEVQITLLLSSRAEMQKVIEEARRTTLSFMQLSSQGSQPTLVAPKVTSSPTQPVQQHLQQQQQQQQHPKPQPPVISLSGFLAQNLNQQKAQGIYSEIPGLGFLTTGGAGLFQTNAPAAGLFSALNAQGYGATTAAGANSAFTQLSEQLKKATEAENAAANKNEFGSLSGNVKGDSGQKRDSGLKKDSMVKRDSGEKSSRYSRSTSRDRDRKRSSRDRSRSRSRDRGRRRSGRDRSRSRSRDRRSRSRSRDRRDRRRRSRSRDIRDNRTRDRSREKEVKPSIKEPKVSRFSDRTDIKPMVPVVKPLSIPPVIKPQPSFISPWETPIQQNLMKLATGNVDPRSTVASPNLPAALLSNQNEKLSQNQNNLASSTVAPSFQNAMFPAVNYGTFQASKPLTHEHINKLQELQTRRDPRIFQQTGGNGNGFGQNNSFGLAQKNNRPNNNEDRYGGDQSSNDSYSRGGGRDSDYHDRRSSPQSDQEDDLSQSVKISNLETATGYGEIRRFFYGQSISSSGIKMINDRNGRRTGVAFVRFLRRDGKRYAMSRDGMLLRRSAVKIESISNKEFEEAVDSYRPGYDDDDNSWSAKDNRNTDDVTNIEDDSSSAAVVSGSLVIPNLPNMTTEVDVMRMFSDFTVMQVLVIKNYKNPKQLDGYAKFGKPEDAKRACESTHKHYIRSRRVFVKPCSAIEYDAAKNEYDMPMNNEDDSNDAESQDKEDIAVVLDDSTQEVIEIPSENTKPSQEVHMDLVDDEDTEQEQQIDTVELGDDSNDNKDNDVQETGFGGSEQWDEEQNCSQFGNRDPRSRFDGNNQQSQQTQPHEQAPKPQRFGSGPGFGGDFNRDPRRRQDFSNVPQNQQQNNNNQNSNFDQQNNDNFGNNQSQPWSNQMNNRDDYNRNNFNDNNDQDCIESRCIFINNLLFTMQEPELQQYFNQERINVKQARMLRKPNGRATGEALVEFQSPQEAEKAMMRNYSQISGRKAFFKRLSRDHIMEIINRFNQEPGPFGGGPRFPQSGPRFDNNNFGGRNNFNNQNFGNNDFRGNNFGNNNFNNRGFGNNNWMNNQFGNNNNFGNNANPGNYGNNEANNSGNSFDQFSNNGNNDANNFNKNFSNNENSEDEHNLENEKFSDNSSNNPDSQDKSECESPEDNSQSNDVVESTDCVEEPMENGSAEANSNNSPKTDAPEDPPVRQPNSHDSEHTFDYSEPTMDGFSVQDSETSEAPKEDQSEQAQVDHQEPSDQNSQRSEKVEDNQQQQQQQHQQEQQQQQHPISGNIMSLANLPFRASNEEIVKFFGQYNITLDDVKRKYLPDGRSTGYAMVRFRSANDAESALKSHQKQSMQGRTVRMWIMDD
ncbi:putative uncharacterized protein DDB_G0282133 [Uranotaenia lowii]|uniref:putative uncharacterized protein DDB_G0282133 n=1 Tax=Uranotaenia lowii TaxID=190385 RepID=UPI002478ADC3|nr:putative uncharacterized protein DDB_G0282133 [Uranotaenia lowii]